MNTDGLTREQVLAQWDSMTPRERDAWIHTEVMGERIAKPPFVTNIPRYTEDISAAFEVEEKIYRMDKVGLVGRYMTELLLIVGSNGFKMVHATPEQRCKAALLAVMDE